MSEPIRVIGGHPFPLSEWDEMVRLYVRDGGNLTMRQVAQKYGVTERAIRYAFHENTPKITKDHPACAPELLPAPDAPAEEVSDAAEAALIRREAAFRESFRQKEAGKVLRDYRKLRLEEYRRERMVELFAEALGEVEVPDWPFITGFMSESPVDPEGDPWLLTEFDSHFGELIRAAEAFGWDFETRIADRDFRATSEWAARVIASSPHHASRINVASGGDGLHAILSQTEHGTRLHADTRDRKVIRTYMESVLHRLLLLAEHGPVHFYAVPGNHGHIFEALVTMWLAAKLDGHPRITIHDHDRRFTYLLHGSTAHFFDHGQGIKKNLTGAAAFKAAETTCRAEMGDDFFRAKNICYYVGHLHEAASAEHSHLELIREPSMVPAGHHATELRLDNRPSARLRRLYPDGLIANTERFYYHHLREEENGG